MKIFKSSILSVLEISLESECLQYPTPFYYFLLVLSNLQILGYSFGFQSLYALSKPFSYYLIKLLKSTNFIYLFSSQVEGNILLICNLSLECLLFFDFFWIFASFICRIYKKNLFKQSFYSFYVINRVRELYYRCFLWILFIPLVDLNINLIFCNKRTLICYDTSGKFIGIIGLILTIYQAFVILSFYVKSEFESSNLLKRWFSFLYFLEYIGKVLIVLLYYCEDYDLFFYLILNLYGLIMYFNEIYGISFQNMNLCIVNNLFSAIHEIIAILIVFHYYMNILDLEEICFTIVILAPFCFVVTKHLFTQKFFYIHNLDFHNPDLSILKLLLFLGQHIAISKENTTQKTVYLNGLFSMHATSCTNKQCKLFNREKSLEYKAESQEIFENWLYLAFNSMKKNNKQFDKNKEIFVLCYSAFLEKNLKKLCFSYYVLKSNEFNCANGKEISMFYRVTSKFYQKNLRKKIGLKDIKNDYVDQNIINIKNFIEYQDMASSLLSDFKNILQKKLKIYKNLLEGYKNFDSFFRDSKKFLHVHKIIEIKLYERIKKKKNSILLMKIKAIFSLMISNDLISYDKLNHQIIEAQNQEKVKKNFMDTLDFVSGNLVLLTGSLIGEKTTIKTQTSKKIANYFGYDPLEFQAIQNVETLLPKLMADNHHLFIRRFLQNKYLYNNENKVRNSFILKKNKYIYPVDLYIIFNFSMLYKNDFCMTVAIKSPKNVDKKYAICDQNGKISSVSESFLAEYITIDWRLFYEKINIYFFFPKVLKIVQDFISSLQIKDGEEISRTLINNEIFDFYCPSNLSIMKTLDFIGQMIINEEFIESFFSKHLTSFKKEYVLLSVTLKVINFPSKKLQILIFTLHNFDEKDLKSLLSTHTKSIKSVKSQKHQSPRQDIVEIEPTKFEHDSYIREEKMEESFLGDMIHAGLNPKFNPTKIVEKTVIEEIEERIDVASSFNTQNNKKNDNIGSKDDPPNDISNIFEPTRNHELHSSINIENDHKKYNETTENLVQNLERKQSTTFFNENMEKQTTSIKTQMHEELNYGMNIVKNLRQNKKYPKVLKKICLVFISQIVLFFVLNIISYIMIKSNLQKFIDYSQKMQVPDQITLSYSYLVATENLLLLIDSQYLNYNLIVLRDLIIELDGHCFEHLSEFLKVMKDPSYNGYFEDSMRIYYFVLDDMITHNQKYRDFLKTINEKLNIQIMHSETFYSEIYDFVVSNFRNLIEKSSEYTSFFVTKALEVKDQQSQFYLMMSLIGLFLSLFLIMINFPFLNEYFVVLEKILNVLAQMNENECESIIEQNKNFFEILDDPSEKYLSFSLEKNSQEKDIKKKKTLEKEKSITRKKKLLSKIPCTKLSRKTLVLLNFSLLIIVSLFYLMVFLLKDPLVKKMELSIGINTKLSDYLESSNLLYSLELLFISENFFNASNNFGHNLAIIKISSDYSFYVDSYLENMEKLEKFLGSLDYLTENSEISGLNSNVKDQIRIIFYDDACNNIQEDACHDRALNNFPLGLNGFWQNYIKASRENLRILLKFTQNDKKVWDIVYSNEILYEKLIDLHIFDHRNMDLIGYIDELQNDISNNLFFEIMLIFLLGGGCCTLALLLINLGMFWKVKNTLLDFRKILILIPAFKLKEENMIYLLKKIEEF